MRYSRLVCLGLNHHSSSVELRERFRCTLADLKMVSASEQPASAAFGALREFALLSTCNRFELYAAVDPALTDAEAAALLYALLEGATGTPAADEPAFVVRYDLAVIQHLGNVAGGLDSLVLGEAQILGQVAAAYQAALTEQTIGITLDALFRTAVRIGKRVRRETAIGSNPASISSIAISLAQEAGGALDDKRIVVIGLGEMGRLTLKALAARKLKQITLVNRTPEKVQLLAADGYAVYGLEHLDAALADADIVISATAADEYILSRERLHQIQQARDARPLIVIDIALPRDVDPAAAVLPGVQLFDLDELNASLDNALAARRREVPKVRAVIDDEVAAFAVTLREVAMRPVVADLRQRAEEIRQEQLARTLRHLGDDVDEHVLAQLNHLSRALVNRLLHTPTTRLREVAVHDDADTYAKTVRQLFDLRDIRGSAP